MRALLVYSLLRMALFVAPFAILMAAGLPWYVSLVAALLFAFAASAVFLRRFKVAAVAELAARRGQRVERADEDAEDDAVDAPRASLADAHADDGTRTVADVDPDVVGDERAGATRDERDR